MYNSHGIDLENAYFFCMLSVSQWQPALMLTGAVRMFIVHKASV